MDAGNRTLRDRHALSGDGVFLAGNTGFRRRRISHVDGSGAGVHSSLASGAPIQVGSLNTVKLINCCVWDYTCELSNGWPSLGPAPWAHGLQPTLPMQAFLPYYWTFPLI